MTRTKITSRSVTLNSSSTQGPLRTVVSASTGQNTYVWDQATGISVEGTSQQTDYSMHTIVEDTNLWQPSEGLDLTVSILVVTAISIALTELIVFWFRKKTVN